MTRFLLRSLVQSFKLTYNLPTAGVRAIGRKLDRSERLSVAVPLGINLITAFFHN